MKPKLWRILRRLNKLPNLIIQSTEAFQAGLAFTIWVRNYVADPEIARRANEVQSEFDDAIRAWKDITGE